MRRDTSIASVLASSLMGGEQELEAAVARTTRTLGREWDWMRALVRRYLSRFASGTRPRHRDVVQFLRIDRTYRLHKRRLEIAHWISESQEMRQVADWDLPAIETIGDLSQWLGIELSDLDWFADLKQFGYMASSSQPVRNYRYRVQTKESGGFRLIEAPKPRLKAVQRRILTGILEKIPPHPAVHGFWKGRSIRTFATPHVAQHVVLKMDLRDFFPSIPRPRVQAIFRTMGYPEAVADRLGGICTNATPRDAWPREAVEERAVYARAHVPQGAPTSPALANLCAYRLDCRVSGLANAAGARYTRYADDLAFSGGEEFERGVDRFSTHAAVIASEEGFDVHHRKTRVMRRGVRQHLAGLVVNERLNVRRADVERLEAILTNCVRHGAASQNREAHVNFRLHLEGRVSFVESIHKEKGRSLRGLLAQIRWE